MAPTVHVKEGIAEQLRAMLKCDTTGELAVTLGMDPSQLSRVFNRRSSPGPTFTARVLLATKGQAKYEDLFEIVEDAESDLPLRRAS